jgi:hypothetical protein
MGTAQGPLFEPDEAVRGNALSLSFSFSLFYEGGGVEKEKLGVLRTEVARKATVENGYVRACVFVCV